MRKATLIGFTLVIAAAVAFGVASLASGASRRSASVNPIAYEPFCYPANGSPGNGGSGWSGGWTGNLFLVNSMGLTFAGFPRTAPGTCNSLGEGQGLVASRALSTAVPATPGTSVVLRALIRSQVNGTPGTDARIGNTSGGGIYRMGDLPETVAAAANWGIQANDGNHFSTVPVQANVTTALTARVDFKADNGGTMDHLSFWVQTSGTYCDPTGSPTAAQCPAQLAYSGSAPPMGAFSGVNWQGQPAQGTALVDEISVDQITPSPGQICVLKFEDKNGNGVQDAPGEGLLTGWVFTVNTTPASTLTSGNTPACVSVPAGTYTVTETQQAGWIATAPPSGTQTVTVSPGQTVPLTFGNKIVPGEICVVKFWDKNENGTQQVAQEPNLANWTINGAGPSPFSLTTTTGLACKFVNPGPYTLTELPRVGWTNTTPTSVNVTVTTMTTTIVKFGNRRGCVPTKITHTTLRVNGGVLDNFTGPQPATLPIGFGTPSQFDSPVINTNFFHEFHNLPNWFVLCRARLKIRVKPLPDTPKNDTITLSSGRPGGPLLNQPIKSWQQYFGAGNPTAIGNPLLGTGVLWIVTHPPKIFVWNWNRNGGLPLGHSALVPDANGRNLFLRFSAPYAAPPFHRLDIAVQDDTEIDYITLKVWWQY